MAERILGHFTFFKFTDQYWQSADDERAAARDEFLHAMQQLPSQSHLYQVFPLSVECDILLWTSLYIDDHNQADAFLTALAQFINSQRKFLQAVRVWWGFTRPSDYARGKSAQEIDPFSEERSKNLTIYPFSKTADWYQMKRDSRQGMMNEHIRIGHQYPQIKQLLLYSTGLQDQEFIVVYEMDDFTEFSTLVSDLRASDARRYTLQDTPVYSAVYHSPQQTLDLFK